MLKSNHKAFISMLSEEKPVLCFYHPKKENEQIKKIKDTLNSIKKDLPLLPLYEYVRDASKEDEYLCDIMEVATYPVLIIYKNGCFNRYKDKNFTKNEILKFLGNQNLFKEKESKKNKNQIEVDLV